MLLPQNRVALPEWQTSDWLNTAQAPTLAALRGRVVLVHAFQMLCPACVTHGLPQAQRVHEAFDAAELAVIALHTVFEHHEAMSPQALRAFVHEFRWSFPIGIDSAGGDGGIPRTMAGYGLRGTPSLLLLDRAGRLAVHHLGALGDLRLGEALGRLLAEPADLH